MCQYNREMLGITERNPAEAALELEAQGFGIWDLVFEILGLGSGVWGFGVGA